MVLPESVRLLLLQPSGDSEEAEFDVVYDKDGCFNVGQDHFEVTGTISKFLQTEWKGFEDSRTSICINLKGGTFQWLPGTYASGDGGKAEGVGPGHELLYSLYLWVFTIDYR